ncbi:MAG: DNRLRE domain-containing protein [Planctomycetota bacterium]
MKNLLLSLTAILVGISSSVNAETIILDASRDNTLYQDNFGNSNGAGDFLFTGQNGGSSPRRGLIAFDLSSIPQNATIDSVSFSLFVSQANSTPRDVSLHRVEADWGEGTSDAAGGEGGGTAATAGDATWDQSFFGTTSWVNEGGDFASTASATASIGGSGSFYSWSSANLVADVQGWLDGSVNNFGWILIGDETEPSTSKRFNSRSNGSNTPALTIEFTAIPEPGFGLVLASVFATCSIRRRR